jgi:hypothetical protein
VGEPTCTRAIAKAGTKERGVDLSPHPPGPDRETPREEVPIEGPIPVAGARATRPRLVVFYQRPVEDPFHGGSAHARGFIAALSSRADVRTVAPRLHVSSSKEYRNPSIPGSVAYILRANAKQLAFVLSQFLPSRSKRSSGIVVFDVYAGALPLLWSKVTGVTLVYYAQDYGGRVARDLRKSRVRGTFAFNLFRSPLEKLLIHQSDVLAVVSDVLRQDFVDLGIPSTRIVTCEMPRRRVDPSPEGVQAWQARLGLRDQVVIVFVGNLGYPPNRRAVDFIVSYLVPHISRARRKWKLILAGPGTDQVKYPDERVIGLGPVEDLDNLLYACHIGLAPVVVEGGISGKLVDYLTHGLVAVATPEAASGVVSCKSLKLVEIGSFVEEVRELIDADRVPVNGAVRPIEDAVVRHYLTESGIVELIDRIETSLG